MRSVARGAQPSTAKSGIMETARSSSQLSCDSAIANVRSGDQVVFCKYHRSRGLDAVDKLRGRPGLRPPRRARDHPLHRGSRSPRAFRRRRPSARHSFCYKAAIFRDQWWALFKSPALDALIKQALQNNPNLQAALATLRSTKEAVYAQEAKYFPLVQANFNPTRQQTSAALAPVPLRAPTLSILLPRN